jgi:invasion protein IalB
MTRTIPLSLAALILCLAHPVLAQDATAPAAGGTAPAAEGTAPAAGGTAPGGPAPAADAGGYSTGAQPANQPEVRVVDTQGSWEVRCITTPDGKDACQMYQLLKEADGNPIAELTLTTLPKGNDAVAGATLLAPLETLLPTGVSLVIDTAKPKTYPFTWCDRAGCYSRIGFLQAELDQLKKGSSATVTIVPMAAPSQKVTVSASLNGFTAAFNSMTAKNEAAAAAGGN